MCFHSHPASLLKEPDFSLSSVLLSPTPPSLSLTSGALCVYSLFFCTVLTCLFHSLLSVPLCFFAFYDCWESYFETRNYSTTTLGLLHYELLTEIIYDLLLETSKLRSMKALEQCSLFASLYNSHDLISEITTLFCSLCLCKHAKNNHYCTVCIKSKDQCIME